MYDRVLREPHYYKVGMYIRLSQEDTDKKYESDSESVLNQRTIITNYIETNGFVLVKCDAGYFERQCRVLSKLILFQQDEIEKYSEATEFNLTKKKKH